MNLLLLQSSCNLSFYFQTASPLYACYHCHMKGKSNYFIVNLLLKCLKMAAIGDHPCQPHVTSAIFYLQKSLFSCYIKSHIRGLIMTNFLKCRHASKLLPDLFFMLLWTLDLFYFYFPFL